MATDKEPADEKDPNGDDAVVVAQQREAQMPPDLPDLMLNDLVIVDAEGKELYLPPLRKDEPVHSIRSILGEVVGYAHLTSYKLLSDGQPLDDFGDLSALQGTQIQIQFERYNQAAVQDHVTRLQQLLDGGVPVLPGFVNEQQTQETQSQMQTQAQTKGDVNENSNEQKKANNNSNSNSLAKKQLSKEEIAEFQSTLEEIPASVKLDLEQFFQYSSATTVTQDSVKEWVQLEHQTKLSVTVQYSFYHPPPRRRILMGDLAYLLVTLRDQSTIHVTATPSGFYANRSTDKLFDPSPQSNCQSSLLDLLCMVNKNFEEDWNLALDAARRRNALAKESLSSPLESLYRVAVRSGYGGGDLNELDSVLLRPSWLAVVGSNEWHRNDLQPPSAQRVQSSLQNTYGYDLRSGVPRDWNEELQSAREMPTETLQDRCRRARFINKVLSDFSEGCLMACRAIHEGHVAAMNPNEPCESHVFLHNNIFVSRAVDSGAVETFKLTSGNRAARKATSRDLQANAMMHRLDAPLETLLYTLGTVLIDYLGDRFVCQTIVPGILQGEKCHSLEYGAVESTSPLKYEETFHKLVETNLGQTFFCGTRTVSRCPLDDARLAEIAKLRQVQPPTMLNDAQLPFTEEIKEEDKFNTTKVCGPVEAKGIKGSDQRLYILDLSRITPRDANWVPKEKGGTGKWEEVYDGQKKRNHIPDSLEDDEWVAAILRYEMVQQVLKAKVAAYLRETEIEKSKGKNSQTQGADTNDTKDPVAENVADKKQRSSRELTEADVRYIESLRLNVNCFMPHLRPLDGIDDSACQQLRKDEEAIREISLQLWDVVIPKLTADIRDSSTHLPLDGRSLTELLHQRGINCRYLGRLALLATEEESKDRFVDSEIKANRVTQVGRRIMPHAWLELLETEMVARAAKHILDRYLKGQLQPIQIVASFLSALVSEAEETAGETETRLEKQQELPDEEDINELTVGDESYIIASRKEVWNDIEQEVGRRFRYKLQLYNRNSTGKRASHAALLRRVCQRTGVRLEAKNYELGGNCLCSTTSGVGLTNSYPISPLDVVDIVPLIKPSGGQIGEGFVSCGQPMFHILLPDAKQAFDAAHFAYSARHLSQALDFAQESSLLYQRVLDNPLHINVVRCVDLTAAILFEAGQYELAVQNAKRALALTVQLFGFDCADAVQSHSTLAHIYLSGSQFDKAVRHIRATVYLSELMGGFNHVEVSTAYQKLSTIFHRVELPGVALAYTNEAAKRHQPDRMMHSMMRKTLAILNGNVGRYREAVDAEKKAYQQYCLTLGEGHELTKKAKLDLEKYMKLAVEQGRGIAAMEKQRQQEQAADLLANELAEEEEQKKKKKKKPRKRK